MDSLNLFKIFLRVAESGSFVKAAQSLNRPTSTVSSAVQELESRLGTRLFHRTTRSVSLTIDGSAFYPRCLASVEDIEETENLFRQNTGEVNGTIRIDVPGRVGTHIIVPALPGFFRSHPLIKIELGVSDRNVNLAEEGIDCALRVGFLESSGMVARKLGYLRIINVASEEYIARYGQPANPEELDAHYSVGYASPTSGRKELMEWGANNNVNRGGMQSLLTVNNAEASIAACVAGMGILQIPAYDVNAQIERNELKEIMPNYRPRSMPVSILYPHRRHLSRSVSLFTEWLTPLIQSKMSLSENDE